LFKRHQGSDAGYVLGPERWEWEAERNEKRALSRAKTAKNVEKAKDTIGEDPKRKLAQSGAGGGGKLLDDATREKLGDLMGRAIPKDVRIHDDPGSHRAAKEFGAHAFVHDRQIYMGKGEFNPDDPKSLATLVHEMTHYFQQKEGRDGVPRGEKKRPKRARDVQAANMTTSGLYGHNGDAMVIAPKLIGRRGLAGLANRFRGRRSEGGPSAKPGKTSLQRPGGARPGGRLGAGAAKNAKRTAKQASRRSLFAKLRKKMDLPIPRQQLTPPRGPAPQGGASQGAALERAAMSALERFRQIRAEREAASAENQAFDRIVGEARQKLEQFQDFMAVGDHHAHHPQKDKPKPVQSAKDKVPLNYIEKFMKLHEVMGHVSEDTFLDELTEQVLDLIENEWQTERERGVQTIPF
jgi:hypothetical protein